MRVLVVEDDTTMGSIVAGLLIAEGHDVILTDSLHVALQTLAGSRFDVVVLDLFLGDSRSLGTLATMRSQAPYVPIVVMTGLEVDEKQVLACGAKELVSKGR